MTESLNRRKYTELIRRAQAGDEVAFEQLYNEFYEPVLRFVALRVPDHEEAQDLAQQVFIRFYKNIGNWQDQGYSPLAYIFTITRSVIADYYRTNKHRKVEASEEILPLLTDQKARPEESIMTSETIAQINQAILALPTNYQEVVSLRLIEGLSNQEIAKIIIKSEVATRKLYSRGLQKLQIILNNKGIEL